MYQCKDAKIATDLNKTDENIPGKVPSELINITMLSEVCADNNISSTNDRIPTADKL